MHSIFFFFSLIFTYQITAMQFPNERIHIHLTHNFKYRILELDSSTTIYDVKIMAKEEFRLLNDETIKLLIQRSLNENEELENDHWTIAKHNLQEADIVHILSPEEVLLLHSLTE